MKKILFFILAIVLLLTACKIAEIPEETAEAESEEPAVAEEVIEETIVQEPSAVILSGLKCIDDKIEGVITNTQDQAAGLNKEIKIIINGLIVIDPECDKATLEAGESTVCSDLSGHFPIRTGKVNTIKLNLLRESVIEYVDCAGEAEEEPEEE